MKPSHIFVTLAFALAACDANIDKGSAAKAADGNIVENAAPALPAGAWKVASEPAVVIGTVEGDTSRNLHNVMGAVRLSDGRIVVANGPAPMLRWFGATGAFLHGTGRSGGGPGEFTSGEGAWIAALWLLPGDSIATWEHQLRRMQVFDPAGKYVRAFTIPLPDSMPRGTYPNGAGLLAGGLFIILPLNSFDGARTDPDSTIYLWYRLDGGFRTIATRFGPEKYVRKFERQGRSQRGAVSPIFAPNHAVRAGGDHLYYAFGSRFEVEVIDTTGKIVRRIRATVPRRKVESGAIAQVRADGLARARDAQDRAEMERGFAALRFADHFPYLRRIRIDRLGHLWVSAYEPPGAASVDWHVFDPAGRWITTTVLPAKLQVYEIGENWILGLTEDELGVERVVVHSLERR